MLANRGAQTVAADSRQRCSNRAAGYAGIPCASDADRAEKLRKRLDQAPAAPTCERWLHEVKFDAGKSAAEVNNGKDTKAADEIEKLWQEVKAAATKAAKARAKAKAVAHV
jgi:hypothetical protein